MAGAILVATTKAPWRDDAFALQTWIDGHTLIEYQIEQLQAAGVRDIEVVLGHDAERVIPLVAADNVEPIVDATWARDPASSLRAGASALVRGTTTAIVLDIAEPRPAAILRALLDAHEAADAEVTVPQFEATRGAPMVFGAQALAALRNVRGGDDAQAIADRFACNLVDVSDLVLLRIDSRASFEKARAQLLDR